MSDLSDIAARIGLPVFACNKAKRPCVKGGFYAATTDRDQIKSQFSLPDAKLIAIPTGDASGLIVIDVDIKNGQPGMDWLNLNADALPQTLTHKTRSGGLHLVFRVPANVDIRNSASRIAPGIDVRGNGGYVIWPPSDGYQVADPTPPAEMPRWLIKECMRESEPSKPAPREHVETTSSDGTKYGLAALDAECAAVRNAGVGTQEITLNNAALKLGALVAGGQIDRGVARRALIAAGMQMSNGGDRPWTDDEVEAKVRRGMDDGAARPRTPPERPVYEPTHHEAVGPDEVPHAPLTDEDIEIYGGYVSTLPKEKTIPHQVPNKVLPYKLFEEIEANLETLDFVEGVMIEGAMSVVYGESNSGKTFWVTDLALHVAAGKPWCGRAVEQGAVIYLALEGSHGISNRVAAFKQEHGLDDARLPFAVVAVSLNLLDPNADAGAVIATVKAVSERMECPTRLIVVDTLARAIAGGNENASEDMGALVATGDKIRQETGSHLTWVHHSGKEQAKGARGHSNLRGATDTEIEITADGVARQAEVKKQRDLPKGDVFRFELSVIELGQNRRNKPVTSCVIKVTEGQSANAAPDRRKSLKGNARRAFDLLADLVNGSGQPGFGAPDGVSSIPEKWWRERFYDSSMPGADPKLKQQAFRRASSELVERGFVGMKSGRLWVVSKRENVPQSHNDSEAE